LARAHQTSSMIPRWSQKPHGLLKAVLLVTIIVFYLYYFVIMVYYLFHNGFT
jgi:hypothetical protein